MPTLTVIHGPDKGARLDLESGSEGGSPRPRVVGRSGADLMLTDFTVSRHHARLQPEGRGWCVEDLKSANGTYVNGKRIERPTRLRHGDQVRVGGTILVWDAADERTLDAADDRAGAMVDLDELDAGGKAATASIIGSVAGADDSIILATPAAAEAVRSWRVMSGLLEAVAAVLPLKQLVGRVMDLLVEEVACDHGFILLKNSATGRYETEAVRSPSDSEQKVKGSRVIVQHVISKKEGVLCTNARSDLRFANVERGEGSGEIGLQSVICVPIPGREELLGVLYLDSAMSRHIYTEEQLRLVAAIAQMAGLAIEDARLVIERMRTERLAAVGETVAALSHYIKNILQGLRGGSDVIEMGLREQRTDTVDQGWQMVKRNLDKIYTLSVNMLAYAKKREPRLEPVQFNLLVEDVLRLLRHRAEDKGVLLKSVLGEPMPAVPVDEDGIHQVVLNIVGNAVDAVPKTSGVVNVRTSFDASLNAVVLTVGDNGPGIPEEQRSRIFEAFYSTKGHGGTGLGLAVAKKIVDEHGGKIEARSEPGEGTLIRVELPATPPKGIDSAATHGPASANP